MERIEEKDKGFLAENLAKRVAAYSAAAGAALSMALPAQATVKVFTASPVTLNCENPYYELDLDGDGAVDFELNLSCDSAQEKIIPHRLDIKARNGNTYNGFVGIKKIIKTTSGSNDYYFLPKKLAKGALIKTNTQIFGSGPLASAGCVQNPHHHKIKTTYGSVSTTTTYTTKCGWGKNGQFNKGKKGYIGVKFIAGDGAQHTGWISFKGGNSLTSPSAVMDMWAYEDWPNFKIKAGSTKSEARYVYITASAGAHGSIKPSGKVKVVYDKSPLFTFKPAKGYAVADVIVDNVSVGSPASYTFPNAETDHTISVSFQKLPGAGEETDQN